MSEDKGKFKILKVTKLDALANQEEKVLPESDLTIQTDKEIIQFEYEDDDNERKKYKIKSGIKTFVNTNAGVIMENVELKTHDLLQSATNTQIIKEEVGKFFKKVETYKKWGKDPKRSILYYSQPGMGKSATISMLAQELIKEDENTIIAFWDTSSLKSSTISSFLSQGSEYEENVSRMILVIEDIGGGNTEDYHGPKGADASLLELLDGSSKTFKIPTFIIATTNTPQTLLKSLADRPGRFDKLIKLSPPEADERVDLVKHIAKRDLTEEEIQALKDIDNLKHKGGKLEFSIAHLSEIVIRSEIDDISFKEVIDQMVNHKKLIENVYEEAQKGMGLHQR